MIKADLFRRFPTVEDCRLGAKRRLPGFLFDFLDGGCDGEVALKTNRAAFDAVRLEQHACTSVENPDLSISCLGKKWSFPLGVSPCGYLDILSPGVELSMAREAQARGVPFIASMSTITPLEDLAAAAPDSMWQQVQVTKVREYGEDIVARAAAAGIQNIVLTVDVPVPSKRARDLRNGFALPLKPTPGLLWDLIRAPGWCLASLKQPNPRPGNFLKYLPQGVTSTRAATELEALCTVTRWEDVSRLRDLWPHKLVIKGVTRAEDARTAVARGVDGVLVSNHGGRQFDAALASIDALKDVVAEIGGRTSVMLDSGVRGGLDVLRGLTMGADFVFSGRSFWYAAGAMGSAGVPHAFDMLRQELVLAMCQSGLTSIDDLRAKATTCPETTP